MRCVARLPGRASRWDGWEEIGIRHGEPSRCVRTHSYARPHGRCLVYGRMRTAAAHLGRQYTGSYRTKLHYKIPVGGGDSA
jgi:hypothetical protein